MHSKGAAPGLRAKQSGTVRGDVAAGSPCPQSWDPAVARSFRARTGLTHLGSGLDRDARGDLSFFAGVFVSADLLPFTVLNRLDCLRAEEISALAVSAISIPNRAATSLSSSTSADRFCRR